MRFRLGSIAVLTLATVIVSCSEHTPTGPALRRFAPSFDLMSNDSIRISEFHYDNTGTDAGEAIEISGPAGASIAGWSLVLYNGNPTSRASYSTTVLTGTIPSPASCGSRGVRTITYTSNGIQNGGSGAAGEPDGIALVNASGAVVEFLSYEGAFIAANGPAAGRMSVNIGAGVFEAGSEPVGMSLQRSGANTWSGPSANTFGTCNDNDVTPPDPVVASVTVTPASATVAPSGTFTFSAAAFDSASNPVTTTFTWSSDPVSVATVDPSTGVATGVANGDALIIATAENGVADTADLHVATPPAADVKFHEIHYDNTGTDVGEAIEVAGPAGTDLSGWSIVLYNGNGGGSYGTLPLSGVIAASCGDTGVVFVAGPATGIQNGAPDGMALVNAAGAVVEFLSYEGAFTATNGPANGMTSTDILEDEAGTEPVGRSLQRNTDGTWRGPVASTFGACNYSAPPPPPGHTFQFFGRSAFSDPPLPVGFQAQIFVTIRDGAGTVVPGAWWSSDTPLIASIDANGVITSLAAGTATFRAHTPDSAHSGTFDLPMVVGTSSLTAQYGHNAEFGEPTDADASDDFIIRRAQYTSSYSSIRNTPNWVAYNIDATHFGPEDRCNCFTHDPMLPASYRVLTTADYTGAGAFAGYGIDRGHLARSFDRTSANQDNATTYYFSNIIPQANTLNTGIWAQMENDLGDSARFGNREVFIITGVAGSLGTIKGDTGFITMPARVWKVALILPRDQGLADVDSWDDVTVIAVDMPNVPVIPDPDPSDPLQWQDFLTTVDAVEAVSGYDLLALLPDQVEIAVESNTRPPVAATDGPYAGAEGSPIAMSAAGSSDPDAGDVLTYAWDFGDGGTASGVSVSHTYANNGVYTVTVTVRDARGLEDTRMTTATVANVAPVIGAFAGATLLPGEAYAAGGGFTDPGADSWTATVDYGDGSGVQALSLSGQSFALAHTYAAAGTFTVTVSVDDGSVTSTQTATVTVMTAAQGITAAIALVNQMQTDGALGSGDANWLRNKLTLAGNQLGQGNGNPTRNHLEQALQRLNTVAPAPGGEPLRAMLERLLVLLAPSA